MAGRSHGSMVTVAVAVALLHACLPFILGSCFSGMRGARTRAPARISPSCVGMRAESCRVYVGNLDYKATQEELKGFMGEAGEVAQAYFRRNGPKLFAFVEYSTPAAAATAVEKLNGKKLRERAVIVAEAASKWPKPKPES
mmetsp:Transcript_17794/g.41471  ORF Transcript_17794/g.41471 Transcript_17794/m.41471 type:complete len:141 (+) Transcript_17794:82-504(+)